MTSERWDQIQEIFGTAVELERSARASYLADACRGDSALRYEVESLLDSYESDPGYLEISAASLAGLPSDIHNLMDDDDAMLGAHVGVYHIIERIGSGGMGSVYLAERDDAQFRQRVALKLVKRGMDSEEIIRRFRSERQIVATLDHPNIARLLDGGITADGRPYFVMEYVEGGVPIDRYCDAKGATIAERLELFRTITAAVHYAHQNLVIHRDLKPANLLVSESGALKLLDFGIAKPLDPGGLGVTAAMTRTEIRLLTPEYASPEQIRGEQITTVSDVYALGVLLYELLTGHRPYRLKSRMVSEIEKVICDEDPERPSSVIRRVEEAYAQDGSTTMVTPEFVASTRGSRIERLRRELDGDLDNIVLKAMHKDPQRRYASAQALGDDVQRYLAGEPVTARRDSVAYRAGKFVLRHKLGVTAASLLFTSISGFGVMMAVQSARIARQSKEITRERDKAEQVVAFLKELFLVSDPEVSRGEMITARELLEAGAARIVSQLRGQPRMQTELMYLMADVFINLGLYDQAEQLAGQSLELAKSAFGEESGEVALGYYTIGVALRWNGKYEESEAYHRRALLMHRRLFGDDHSMTAEMLSNLGVVLRNRGELDEAEKLYREALAIHRKNPARNPQEMARNLNNLALVLRNRGENEEAGKLYHETLEIQKSCLHDDHPELATTMNNLARLLSSMGEYDLAEPLDRGALAIRRRVLRDHPSVAQSLNNLGSIHILKKELEPAEECFREALSMLGGLLDPDHPEILSCMHNLARVRTLRGDYDDAEAIYNDLFSLQQKRFGPDHPHIARTLNAMGELMAGKGELSQAETYYREALAMRRAQLGDSHWRTAMTALGLGELMILQKRYAEAEELLQESHETLRAQAHSTGERASQALVELYRKWGESDAAMAEKISVTGDDDRTHHANNGESG
jgi:eukaryotic-like serine/threonine-protein kinase